MNKDMTYCSNQKCKYMECERNPNHIKVWRIPHSYAQFEYTEYCLKQGDKDKGGDKQCQ